MGFCSGFKTELLENFQSYAQGLYVKQQWRTENGVRGLEPIPLAYDLRKKRDRKRHNMAMAFSTKKYEKFSAHGLLVSGDIHVSFMSYWLGFPGEEAWKRRTVLKALTNACAKSNYDRLRIDNNFFWTIWTRRTTTSDWIIK